MSAGEIRYPKVEDLDAKLHAAHKAIYEHTGSPPTYFVVGRATFLQLRWRREQQLLGNGHTLIAIAEDGTWFEWNATPVYLDPTFVHRIVAVPRFAIAIAGELPPGAVWEGP